MTKKYIVVDDNNTRNSYGDIDIQPCASLEEANREARHLWEHLTKREQATRHIYVAYTLDDSEAEYREPGMFDSDLL